MLNVIQLTVNKYNKLQNDYICTLLSNKIKRVRCGGFAQQDKTLQYFSGPKFEPVIIKHLVSVSPKGKYHSVAFYSKCYYFFTKGIATSHSG